MSHFAKVIDGIVTEVIVAEQDFIDYLEDKDSWIQTSYNTYGGKHPENRPLRKNYAGIGFTYDIVKDAFIPPQPYASWSLNEESCLWEAPVDYPSDTGTEFKPKYYNWDESQLNWVEIKV